MEKISIVALRRERNAELETAALLRARRRERHFTPPIPMPYEPHPPAPPEKTIRHRGRESGQYLEEKGNHMAPDTVTSEPVHRFAANEFTFDVVLEPALSEAIVTGYVNKQERSNGGHNGKIKDKPNDRTVILRFNVRQPSPSRIFTTEEACAFLKVGRRTIYRYIKGGKLEAQRLGSEWRFKEKDLLGLLSKART